MSTGPDWVNKALNNTIGNKVGDKTPTQETIAVETRKKPGRKKSIVKRKQVMMSFSEDMVSKFDLMEAELKLAKVPVTRGRSEVAELAVNALRVLMHNPENKAHVLSILKDLAGQEERFALEDTE